MRPYRGFADLIRKRRKELHLTLSDVADRTEWSIPYISELERGVKQPPPYGSLGRLACALEFELELDQLASEAEKSRRSVEIDLEGAGVRQRELAVILGRRLHQLTDEEAESLLAQLVKLSGGEDGQ